MGKWPSGSPTHIGLHGAAAELETVVLLAIQEEGEGTMRTITDDLVLLLLDPESGRLAVDGFPLERAIAGALLLDLSVRNRITAGGEGARAKIIVTDAAPTGDELLDGALVRLAGRPLRARRAVDRVATRLRNQVLERLAARGVVVRPHSRRFQLIEVRAWPMVDRAPVDDLRGRLAAVLRNNIKPDQHLACLVSLVHAVKAEHKLV
jgi:hypothetical protein